jgi:drug/metabolite transporter (DMT)-like permease
VSDDSHSRANLRGILAMIVGMLGYGCNDMLIKLLSKQIPIGEITMLRGPLAFVLALAMAIFLKALPEWRAMAHPLVLLRALIEVISGLIFMIALSLLPLGNAAGIQQSAPLITTVLAVALYKIHVGWQRWVAIFIGFIGVLLIVQPTSAGFQPAALLALAASFLFAIRDLVTRRIPGNIHWVIVMLTTTLGTGLGGMVLSLFQGWQTPSAYSLGLVAAAALAVTVGNAGVIMAFRGGDVSVVSPFRYTIALVSIGFGYLVFDEIPDALAFTGIGLIVGSGLYLLHCERRRAVTNPAS